MPNTQDLGHNQAPLQQQQLHEENLAEGSKNEYLVSSSPVGTNRTAQMNAATNQI